jgi:adenylate kinase
LYQRPDDREETVKERIKVFLAQTVPVLDYYEKQGRLVKVNGNLGAQEVAREIFSTLRAGKE